jgi:hypothetical protein
MYEKYYEECEPSQCIYIYETKDDIIYIIATVFGLAGGLVMILEFIIPRLLKFVRQCIERHGKPIVPEVQIVGAEPAPILTELVVEDLA